MKNITLKQQIEVIRTADNYNSERSRLIIQFINERVVLQKEKARIKRDKKKAQEALSNPLLIVNEHIPTIEG